jgi:hypothetical protein
MRRATRTALLCSLCLGAATAAFGQAQNDFARDRDLGVLDRPRPEYDALGVPVSTFLMYPKLNVVTGYNDNIFASQTGTQGAGFVQLQPSIGLKSQWSQNELDFFTHASINRYFDHGSENTEDYGAGLNGRLDVLADTKLTGGASYDLETEPREAETALRNTVNPVQYGVWQAQASGSHQFNRLQISLSGTWDSYNYLDGQAVSGNGLIIAPGSTVFVDEHYRNVQDYGETLRADYALSPDTAVFVSGNINQHNYSEQPPLVPFNYNSHGSEILGGVNFQISSLLTGEVGIGYFQQDFPHVVNQNLDGFAIHGTVQWFPTELTTVTLKVNRFVQDSAIQTSAGYVDTGGVVEVDHELRYNVILSGIFSYNHDSYQGLDRTDDRWGAGLGAKYLFTREVGLGLNFNHDSQVSSGANRFINFDINRVMLNLVLQR